MVDPKSVTATVVGEPAGWRAYRRAAVPLAVGVVVAYVPLAWAGLSAWAWIGLSVTVTGLAVARVSYTHVGFVPALAVAWGLVCLSWLVPPSVAVAFGGDVAPWYRMPSPSVVGGLSPGDALSEAIVTGPVVATVLGGVAAVVAHTLGNVAHLVWSRPDSPT